MLPTNQLTNKELLTEMGAILNELETRISSSSVKNNEVKYSLEDEVRNLSHQLQESERGKSQFLSNVRNEINNPLTSILGLASTIQSISKEDNVKRLSLMIYNQAFELNFQIRNIIITSEIEMGEIKPMSSMVDVVQLMDEQIATLQAKISAAGVTIRTQIPEHLNFQTDPYLLQYICQNVLANAIEFSGENKLIILNVNESDSHLTIEVTDFGQGISQDKQELIFNRFRQAEQGSTKSHPGHGLGLTVVSSLVDILDGAIELKSQPDFGTKIKIILPALNPSDKTKNLSLSGSEVIFDGAEEF